MSETNVVDLPASIRPDQKELLLFIRDKTGASISYLTRRALDDARASLLAYASLQESDLPEKARKQA